MKGKNDGFTLIETMIALSLLLVIVSFSPLFIKAISPPKASGLSLEELESFYTALGTAVREAKKVEVQGEKLMLISESGQSVSFSIYQNRVRKQINGQGYEIWLFSVKRFTPALFGNSVSITITDTASKVYERAFIRYTNQEAEGSKHE